MYGAEMGDKKEVAEKLLEYYNEDEDEEDSDEEELEGTSTARQTEEETGR